MKKLIAFVAVIALAMPAYAVQISDNLVVTGPMDNGDGSYTYWFEVDTLPEVSFMELWIMGNLHQVQAHADNYALFGPAYAPDVIFSSDAGLATAFDPVYAASANLDTIVDNSNWIGTVIADLVPDVGDETDGTQMVHIAVTSFTGPGQGGPLPGGLIPLAHVTVWGLDDPLWITGRIQSDSDPIGAIEFHTPEPSTLALAGFGLMGLIAGMRRRRS